MNVQAKKIELVDWIIHLKNFSIIKEIEKVKGLVSSDHIQLKREFGCGKGIFTYISDDFDEPLSDFKEYMK